jgi:hypothetical protein
MEPNKKSSNTSDDYIDPASFFNNTAITSVLTNIPDHIVQNATDNVKGNTIRIQADRPGLIPDDINNSRNITSVSTESAVIIDNSSQEDQAAELLKKYGNAGNKTNVQVIKQQQSIAKLLGEEESQHIMSAPIVDKNLEGMVIEPKKPNQTVPHVQKVVVQQPSLEDNSIAMFNKIKKTEDFNISFSISEKIPKNDFIKMWEESFDLSIIDHLADEFVNKLLQDPSSLKDEIVKQLKKIVYNTVETSVIKDSPVKKSEPEINILDRLDELDKNKK